MDDLKTFLFKLKVFTIKMLFIFKNKKLKAKVFNFSILKVKIAELKLYQVKV